MRRLAHHPEVERSLKTYYSVAVSLLAGLAAGAGAVQALHAEAKPPAYVVSEMDLMDVASFNKEYVPAAMKAIADAGGQYVARNGRSVSLEGVPPKRIAIIKFDSLAKAEAAFNSQAYKDAQDKGGQYADFRVYAIEGVPQ
jgi:uncharacterized protein (DUF1330 family)